MFNAKKAMTKWAKAWNETEEYEKKRIINTIKDEVRRGHKVIYIYWNRFNHFNNVDKFIEFLAPLGYGVKEKNYGVEIYIDKEEMEKEK